MQSKVFTPRFIYISVAIFIAAISRLLPHPPNFTPIAAMALFGGACMTDKKFAFIIPLLAMFISDCILQLVSGTGFHNTLPFVYASFAITVGLGFMLRTNNKAGRIFLVSVLSSCIFFAITNLATWWFEGTNGAPMYAHNLQGLISCFIAAIPFYNNSVFGSFFLNTIMGDLFYCGILFSSFYFAKSKFPALD
jgi:hypothetical protein